MKKKTDKVEKLVVALTPDDFKAHPVWSYTSEDESGDWLMTPVENLPVNDLWNKVIGVPVRLANGNNVWATLCNVFPDDEVKTNMLLTISFEKDRKWFHLDSHLMGDHPSPHGPLALAKFLGMDIDDVFPVTYDLRPYVTGTTAIFGEVHKNPPKEMTLRETKDFIKGTLK